MSRPLSRIAGIDRIVLEGAPYHWDALSGAYISRDDRVLQDTDVAVLYLNDTALVVGDPTSIGFGFKGLSDPTFSGGGPRNYSVYLACMKKVLGVESDWEGELKLVCGDSVRVAQLPPAENSPHADAVH
jgi:hypothetical protein